MGTPQGIPPGPKGGPYFSGDQIANRTVISVPRDPTGLDSRNVAIGTVWVNPTTNSVWMLTSSAAGVATWTPLGGSGSSLVPITKYVVDSDGSTPYQTIQSAINAANAAGGGAVYIRPGLYVENLTLFNNIDLYGACAVSQNQGESVSIQGTHTPPASGHCGFNSICFLSTTDGFSSVAAGSAHLVFLNCESAIQSGYFLNLPNWTGIFELGDNNPQTAGAPWAINDGGINNPTGGATLFIFSAAIGAGTNVCQLSGLVVAQNIGIGCPVQFNNGVTGSVDQGIFSGTVTYAGNSQVDMSQSRFTPASGAAIAYGTSAANALAGCIIDTATNPSISGSGAGNLQLTDVSFLNDSNVAGTLTTSNGVLVPSGGGSVPDPLTLVNSITTTSGDLVATIGNVNAGGANIGPNTSTFSGMVTTQAGVNAQGGVTFSGGSPLVTPQPLSSAAWDVFSPSVESTGGGAASLISAGGTYGVLNSTVTVAIAITIDDPSGLSAGDILITGLPAGLAPLTIDWYGSAFVSGTTFAPGTSLFCQIQSGNPNILIGACQTGAAPYYLQDTDLAANSVISINITYNALI